MEINEFELLFRAHARPLLAYLVERADNVALAEDVLADAFERGMRRRNGYDPSRGGQKTWLYAIALNRLRDVKRRAAVESGALERLGMTAVGEQRDLEERVVDTDMLRRAVADLPENEQQALVLRYAAGLSGPQLAELLGEPVSRVDGRVYRGLRKLRKTLAEEPSLG
jgi:RNA polymerase sigma factor (sigma-70 family)